MFVDQVKIKVTAGRGGDGCASFRKEKFVDKGGPDGGSGGRGGDVIIRCDSNLATLLDFQFKSQFKAKSGVHGKGKNKDGKNGESLVINVPPGTVVEKFPGGDVLADLVEDGQEFFAARGGRGGRGNTFFKSSTNRAPRQCEQGLEGEVAEFTLELKLIADVGIVGCPNAGKSSLVSRISNASPKIAGYPFTTIEPKVGAVTHSGAVFTAAEIPGLIEGAHEGKGLGDRFLRHIERTKFIVHLVDLSFDPVKDYRVVEKELAGRGFSVADDSYIICGNKNDLPGSGENFSRLVSETARGRKTFSISCVTGDGIPGLLDYLAVKMIERKNANS